MSENFTGVTFPKQKVTPSYDGLVRRVLLSDGTLSGCEMSYSGSTLTMAAGQLMICGRQIVHPSSQNWAVTEQTSGFARLVLTIDLTRTSTKDTFDQVVDSIQYATDKDGFVELEQTDINTSGTKYQVAVCLVSLGPGGITGIVSQLGRSEGGGGLNFKVVDGPTAPGSPTENNIWVKTSVAMPYAHLNKQPAPTWASAKGTVTITYEPIRGTGNITANTATLTLLSKKVNGVMNIFAQFTGCFQNQDGTASGWKSMNAYIYKSGKWVQFSSEFSATIKVTYPSGSTLTCTDGTTTLTATTTTGSYTFTVPNAGTWTIKAVSGSNSASQSVSITTSGQSASVTLTYFDGYLLKNGVWSSYACPNGITGGFNLDRITKETYDGTVVLRLKSQCRAFSADKIAVSKYTKLNATVHNIYRATFTLALASTQDDSSVVASTTSTTTGNISLDISSITSASYLMLSSISTSTDDGEGTRITNIWLS